MTILVVQRKLASLGFSPGKIDGVWGPATEGAVIRALNTLKPQPPGKLVRGIDLVNLALAKVGQEYVYGADVPLDDPNWDGPWDCAELMSWDAFQATGIIYGCVDNHADNPDPYTGGWLKDLRQGYVIEVSVAKAADTPGGMLLRYRQGQKHIVMSQGKGRTVEAKSASYGVCEASIGPLTSWDHGIFLPGVTY